MRFESALALLQTPADGTSASNELHLVVLRDPNAAATNAESSSTLPPAGVDSQQPQAGELRYGDTSLVSIFDCRHPFLTIITL